MSFDMDKPHRGTIEGWVKSPYNTGRDDNLGYAYYGLCAQHPCWKEDYFKNKKPYPAYTESVVHEEGNEIETYYERYTLGTPSPTGKIT